MQENQMLDYWNQQGLQKEFSLLPEFDILPISITDKSKILDYGCGYGRLMKMMQDRGFENIYGYDPAEKLIEKCKTLYPNFNVSDNLETYSNQKFDLITLFGVLTCIPNDFEQANILQKCYKLLNPNGYIYIKDFLLNNDKRNKERYDVFFDDYYNSNRKAIFNGLLPAIQYGVFELEDGAILRHHEKEYIFDIVTIADRILLYDAYNYPEKIIPKKFDICFFAEQVHTTMNGNKSNGFSLIARKR